MLTTVVICRKFLIFAQTITPASSYTDDTALLWFVENFLSLHRQSHHSTPLVSTPKRCDLSKISYLCTDNHTQRGREDACPCVVICRKFLIFAQTITPEEEAKKKTDKLWFVENFLSLHRQSHLGNCLDNPISELWFVENFLSLHRQSHRSSVT